MPTADPIRTADIGVDETPDLMYQLDAAGRRRSKSATKGYKQPRPPATKGRKFPPDPPTIEDMAALLAECVPQRPGSIGGLSALRLRALLVILWRTGVRISEALALEERDLNRDKSMIVVKRGKGGKRRLVVMDDWGWKAIEPWLEARLTLPPGPVFCVLDGPTAGRAMHDSDVRRQFAELRDRSGVRCRVAAHQLRHAHAVDLQREGHDLLAIQAQLGHANPGITMIYLRSIAVEERLAPIAARKPPMVMLPT